MFSACCCSWLWVLNLRQLGDAVDELGDLGAEALLDVGQAVLGVLGDVVEERRLDRGRVDPELGQDLGRGDRVGDVRLAGGALLALVGGRPRGRTPGRPARGRRRGARRGSPRRGRRAARRGPGPPAARDRAAPRPAPRRGPASRRGVAGRRLRAWSRACHRSKDTLSRSRPGAAAASGLGALVPGDRAVGADDRLLVALAGEQHDVARPGALERRVDGGAAVGDDQQVVVATPAGGLGAARDLVEDRRRGPRRAGPRR